MEIAMSVSGAERDWVRRLAVGTVLITCAGGGVFVIVSRPHGDCVVVGDMMRTYSAFQSANPPVPGAAADARAVAKAEAATADTLHRQARAIERPELHTAADSFADAVASSAQAQLDAATQIPELDPFDAVLPEVDPAELQAGDIFTASAHLMLVACPSAPHPAGLS
jgi:hypothetical protein